MVENGPSLSYTFADPSQAYAMEGTVSNPFDSQTGFQSMSISALEKVENQIFLPMVKR